MIYETIELPNRDKSSACLKTYIIEKSTFNPERKRPLVIVIPGGGYEHIGHREGEPVALRMNSLGFHAAILSYAVAPMKFPDALCDLANAVALIRQNAEKWAIDSSKIIVCGFSAGGHLAASLGCFWNSRFLKDYVHHTSDEIRPNYLCLCYPVITSDKRFCHEASIQNVIGSISKSDSEKICRELGHTEMRDVVSLEKNVSTDFPPSFLWHTVHDETVPAKNTILLADALYEKNIDFEYHLFNRGKHALSLANSESALADSSNIEKECAVWPELFVNWFEGLPSINI